MSTEDDYIIEIPVGTGPEEVTASEAVIDKAAKLIRGETKGQLRVLSEALCDVLSERDGKTRYRVTVNRYGGSEWITCTCRHGQSNKGRATCYHAVAFKMYLDSVWDEELTAEDLPGVVFED